MKNKLLMVSAQNSDEVQILEGTQIDIINIEQKINSGGTAPSFDFVAISTLQSIKPIYVTIKIRVGTYILEDNDKNKVKQILEIIKPLNITGIKISNINQDGTIDEKFLQEIINLKGDLKLIYGRGVDSTRDYREAIYTLAKYKDDIEYIATSGGAETARDGLYNLSFATNIFPDKIIAGSRIDLSNIDLILETKKLRGIAVSKAIRSNNDIESNIENEFIDLLKEKLNKSFI